MTDERLAFLLDVAGREATHLALTDARLFALPMTAERAASLGTDVDLAERVDAFVARFGRLQDTLGDKVLPRALEAVAEPLGPAIDNLMRAERLGWLVSADRWLVLRRLRNRMIHEYIRDPAALAGALTIGHQGVPELRAMLDAVGAALAARDLL